MCLRNLNRHPLQSEFLAQAFGHGPQRILQVLLADQSDHVIQDKRLALALLRLAGALALPGGELASDDRGHQKQQQRDPLPGVGNTEMVEGFGEEPVERQERHDRGKDGRSATVDHGDREHSHQVQHRDVREVHLTQHQPDEAADQSDCCKGGRIPQPARSEGTPDQRWC